MRAPFLALLPLFAALAACGRGGDGAVEVAVIGTPEEMFATGTRLAPPAELVRGATAQGLVRLDEAGQLVPGIAERWIVTDDGASYIFRIREMTLPGGRKLDARSVQQALTRSIRSVAGTSLGLDLARVRDVRAMTGRVIEIRLKSAMPGFLQLLAQPELGIVSDGAAAGPMALAQVEDVAVLTALPPELRGMPSQPDWAEEVRAVRVHAVDAVSATRAFSDGRYSLILGGTLSSLPLVNVGPLSRGTVRLDSALGLFGLDITRETGFLADAGNREALALALDRNALIRPFNIGGWVATTRMVAPNLSDGSDIVPERWDGIALDDRRAAARARVARWKGANGGALALSIALPDGPGSDTLFAGLGEQWGQIGVSLVRVPAGDKADLVLRDRVARYAGAGWFLNQFNCRVARAICSEEADFLVQQAASAPPAEQAGLLAEAERALTAANRYIPIGAPIRWSLVRAGVTGFGENAWAIHPLFPLSRAPI